MLLFVVHLLVTGGAGWAQVPIVSGRVLDASGQPLSGIPVTLLPVLGLYEQSFLEAQRHTRPPATSVGETDIDGRFQLRVPDFGMWRLEAGGQGRELRTWPLYPLTGDAQLPPARLRPAHSLEVQLLNTNGATPAAGLVLVAPQGADARAWLPAPNGGWLDGDGRTQLDVARDLPLQLLAWAPGHQEVETRLEAATDFHLQRLSTAPRVLLEVHQPAAPSAAAPSAAAGTPETDISAAPTLAASSVAVRAGKTGWLVGHTNLGGRITVAAAADQRAPLWLQAEDGSALSTRLPAVDANRPVQTIPLQLQPPWRLQGRVVDADSGTPIDSAWIWFEDDPGAAAQSGADGRFELVIPATGQATRRVRAGADGYTPVVEVLRQPPTDWTLRLPHSLTLGGRVVDANDQPVEGADVYAVDPRHLAPLTYAESGIDGRFELPNLAAGSRYRLHASHPEHSAVQAEHSTSTWPRDLVLQLGPVRQLFGRTLDAEGNPLAGVEVTLFTPQPRLVGGDFFRVESDADGHFELTGIPDGEYHLRAELSGYLPAQREVPHLDANSDPESGRRNVGTLVLQPATSLFGQVTGERDRPVPEVEILVVDDEDGRELAKGRSDTGGGYEILSLPTGRLVTIELVRDGFLPARFTGIPLPHDGALDLELIRESRLSGTIVDRQGQALPGASVRLLPANTETPAARLRRSYFQQPREQTSNAEGNFRFVNLLPGSYRLQIRLHGYKPFEGNVLLPPGVHREDARLSLEKGAVLEGRVLAADGQPIESAELRAVVGRADLVAAANSLVTFSGPGGVYRFDELPINRVVVTVKHPEHPPLTEIVELVGEVQNHDFVMGDVLHISGTVLLPDGSPAIGANVLAANQRLERTATSEAPDGHFRVDALGEGTYELVASLPGYPPARLKDPLGLFGSSEEGVVLRLSAGTRVSGRIFGLQPEELLALRIHARSGVLHADGRLGADGGYEVEGLTTGTWRIEAWQMEDGRRIHEDIDLFEGDDKTLDLTFPATHNVSGRVLHRGEPVPAALVGVLGSDSRTETDYLGQFHLPKVPEGERALTVFAPARGLEHREELRVDRDLQVEVVLASQQVLGQVFDAATGEPLRGFPVYLQWNGDQTSPWTEVRPSATTDTAGNFRITGVPAGSWGVVGWHPAYLPEVLQIEVRRGTDVSGLTLQMRQPAQR